MSTNTHTHLAPQQYGELFGQVIGLYGDPTNQDTDSGGVTMASLYQYVNWTGASDLQKILFWSRVLICVIFNPYDSGLVRARIALVLKPRSLWLYSKSGKVADFVGNEAEINSIGTADADNLITSVNPPYNFGDLIRISVLPSSLNASNWSDSYTRLYSEYYDAQATLIRDTSLAVSNMTIKASLFIPAISDFSVSKIVYYDKNVDARTRIVGGGTSGPDVTIPICAGGVTSLYRLKGTQIS